MLQKNKEIVAYCCLKKALFLDPFRWDIHANLGLILIKIKKYKNLLFLDMLELKCISEVH